MINILQIKEKQHNGRNYCLFGNIFKSLLVIAILIASFAPADAAKTKPYNIKLKANTSLKQLSDLCSIENRMKDGTFIIYANDKQLNGILPLIESYQERKIKQPQAITMAASLQDFMESYNKYPMFTHYLGFMNLMQADYPTFCRIDTIGYSVNVRPLVIAEITSAVNQHSYKPQVLLSSSIHGNECTGYMLLCRLMNYLMTNYNSLTEEGARARRIVDSLDIWIMPLNNPDGTYSGSNYDVSDASRENGNGVDLNRNFPDRFRDSVNTKIGKELETVAMMDFISQRHFSLSANFHDGTSVVNYPWDGASVGFPEGEANNCPDSLWYYRLSRGYADYNTDMSTSTEFEHGITVGTAWYIVQGGRQDWAYNWYGSREVTIELSESGLLSSTELTRQWEINKESLLRYLEQALNGINGDVRNEKGTAIAASVHLLEIPEMDVCTDPVSGRYVRFVDDGTYNIVFSADGYITDTVKNVQAKFGSSVAVNVVLKEKTNDVKSRTDNELTSIIAYPNPASTQLYVKNLVDNANYIKLYDCSGRIVFEELQPDKLGADGFSINVSGLNDGVYYLKISGQFESRIIPVTVIK